MTVMTMKRMLLMTQKMWTSHNVAQLSHGKNCCFTLSFGWVVSNKWHCCFCAAGAFKATHHFGSEILSNCDQSTWLAKKSSFCGGDVMYLQSCLHVVHVHQSPHSWSSEQLLFEMASLAQIFASSWCWKTASIAVLMGKPDWTSNPLALTKAQASLLVKLGAPLLLLLTCFFRKCLWFFYLVIFLIVSEQTSRLSLLIRPLLAQVAHMWFRGNCEFWLACLGAQHWSGFAGLDFTID